jgi:Transposase zinc-binding domain
MRPALEVADIFRHHGPAYVQAHDVSAGGRPGRVERRVMSALELCRTSALGGHVEGCRACGTVHVACNSCRNRHCPSCWKRVFDTTCQGSASSTRRARAARLRHDVPGRGRARLAGGACGRPAAGPLFPRGLHTARRDRSDSLPEQDGRLRHPVQVRRRDAAHLSRDNLDETCASIWMRFYVAVLLRVSGWLSLARAGSLAD